MLLLPLIVITIFSFGERAPAGGYIPSFTFDQYLNLSARFVAFKNTLTLAPIGTIIALIIGYPLAYYLVFKVEDNKKNILGSKGIPNLLEYVGIENLRLINTPFAVLVGIVYSYLPLMVLPIYVSLEKLDKRLLEASSDLGASNFKNFINIIIPLSIPGIATGCMLVFILLMGEFLIPAFLGGGKVFFVGNALVDLFLQSRNWPFGSAVACSLVIIMLIIVSIYMKFINSKNNREDVSII
jgi:spermidine/putrescine transport system permease protein